MSVLRLASGLNNATLIGIGLALFSVFLFTINNALGKLTVATLPIGEFMFLRSLVSIVWLAPFCWRAGRAQFRAAPKPGLQLLRVVTSIAEIATFYWAARHLPLADILIFWLAAPIYVTALSALLLGEKVGWRRWTAVLVGFFGVILVMRPSAASITWPALVGFLGGVLFAGGIMLTRFLRDTADIVLLTINVSGLLLAGLVTLPFAFAIPTPRESAILLAMGTFAVIGSLYFIRALRLAPASVIAPYKNTALVWGALSGYLIFGEVPDMIAIVGAAIIVGASLYIFLRERKLGKQIIVESQ
jgi:drug/metabolite transporter (DMT)-like permease